MTERANCTRCGERFSTYSAKVATVCGACEPRGLDVDWGSVAPAYTRADHERRQRVLAELAEHDIVAEVKD